MNGVVNNMYILKVVFILGVASMFSACASGGATQLRNVNEASAKEKIQAGYGKEQVKSAVGDPTSVAFTDSGQEIWTYDFSSVQSKPQNFIPVVGLFVSGVEGEKKTLVILFDKNDLVQKHTFSTSSIDQRTGILGG